MGIQNKEFGNNMSNFNAIDGGFLQSPQWEKFQNEIRRKTHRINADGLTCLAIESKLPLAGKYFFLPRGPVASAKADEITNYKLQITNKSRITNNKTKTAELLEKLIMSAGENDVGWIRVEPQSFEDLEEIKNGLSGRYEMVKSKKDHEPVQTLMVNLIRSEEDILAGMKPKTRYNIRLSEKKGVTIYFSRDEEKIEVFLDLLDETANRDGIKNHPRDYYRKMIGAIAKDNIRLILAEYEKNIIAGAAVVFYDSVATYLHGASSNEMRNLMAPFGVQWAAIKMAKEKGCEKYDLGGVSLRTENYPELKKGWEGITRFKVGFCPGNKPVEFPGCWDIVLNGGRYKLYRILQGAKKIIL